MARGTKSTAANAENENSFPFIVSNGPGVTKDPALRTLIRKQAMKDVGLARKRRGNSGRINTHQPIAYEKSNDRIEHTAVEVSSNSPDTSFSSRSSPETSATSTGNASSESPQTDLDDFADWTIVCQPIIPPEPFIRTLSWSLSFDTGYERVRSRFCVDLTQLTLMTNFNMSKFAIQVFGADPGRLSELMQDRQWSFLEFVPSRYGSSKPLAAATDCLLAKVSKVLAPYTPEDGLELRLYTKALRALQIAIADPSSSYESDTLAAIQIMSLYELLDPGQEAAWSSHIKGAARLIRHRTPKRFTSEFEKAVFAGHVGPEVSEALMLNEPCYLAEKQWLDLYSAVVDDTKFLTERSTLMINGRKLMLRLPGLWHDVDGAVRGDDLFDDTVLAALEVRCRAEHSDYLQWLEDYKDHCLRTSLDLPPESELGLRREIFGATLECLCILKRLIACVCDNDRFALELEAQALAKFVLDLQNQPGPKHSWLFTPHEVSVAMSIQASQETFEEDVRGQDLESRKLAMRKRYHAWNGLLRKQH